MARDRAILDAVAARQSPPTLRLYGWNPPCLSLGRHQIPDAANAAFCRHHGIDVVRRPSGGRAVLHHLELTYAVVAPVGVPPLPRALQEAYTLLCSSLVHACRSLGVEAHLTGGEVNLSLPGPRSAVPCFQGPAGGEVVVGGRKLIGSALRAHGRAVLQHGAILLDWDGPLQAGSMGLTDDHELRPHVTTLTEQMGRPADRQVVEQAVVNGFAHVLGICLVPGALTDGERQRETELVDSLPEIQPAH
jgi:lipoate-protein ligase A